LDGVFRKHSKLVNEAADKYFVGNAQLLRKLETVERSLARNAKIVIPADPSPAMPRSSFLPILSWST
jgi:hypothetical protein